MKKIIMTILATLLLSVVLVGCGNSEETDLNKALGAKEMTVTPTKVTREKAATDRKRILKIEVKVKNNTEKPIGIGAGNFALKDADGKEYDIYGMKTDSLGQEVAAGKTITGNIYFEIPASLEKGWMNYAFQMDQEPVAEWLLSFPGK
ncbi:DUF4352 domain-containing protein [Listeria weihenstephanensis]|uniref:DUF4352 domain-containing protein n=1 Tax=Listeria weihenstephanensis TaxID=1006155 RepID=A0A841Z8B1_9LIST|nr:DUF4352 domain-containing protein [Listeria weihenstephanensis]MBC1501450.1 DUF4352 domain-containing protein [Listeria weihenstephanensis]